MYSSIASVTFSTLPVTAPMNRSNCGSFVHVFLLFDGNIQILESGVVAGWLIGHGSLIHFFFLLL